MVEHGKTIGTGWYIRSSTEVKQSGHEISSSDLDLQDWYPATVPSTVLAALVKNGVYEDPYFAKNLETIPQAQFKRPWWYRAESTLENREALENTRLIFEGINYRADIWLNGRQIASSDTVAGSFRIFEIDITGFISPGRKILSPGSIGHLLSGSQTIRIG